MKRYEVLMETFGFKNFYWESGQIVELEDDEQPPESFFRLIPDNSLKIVPDEAVSEVPTLKVKANNKRGK